MSSSILKRIQNSSKSVADDARGLETDDLLFLPKGCLGRRSGVGPVQSDAADLL